MPFAARRGDRGFTLTEIIVTMILISTLAAIAIPVFLKQRERGYQASVQSDVRTAAQTLTGLLGEVVLPGDAPALVISGDAPKLTMAINNITRSTSGGTTVSDVFKISPGTTVVDTKLTVAAGKVTDYCLVFQHNGQYAKVTDSNGLETSATTMACGVSS